jgi:integrase
LLKLAYKEGWLRENVNDYLDRIDWEEPKINYLEIEEVKKLATTPCKVDVLKRASLFACMTGLRISDILQLRWENIELSARWWLLYAHPYPEDQDSDDIAIER